MRFPYYARLSSKDKTIYRASDKVVELALPKPRAFAGFVTEIEHALEDQARAQLHRACQGLCDQAAQQFAVGPVRVVVLAARPSDDWGELQGQYETSDGQSPAVITVWMRTAQKRQVVAFKTFLRTLLHELVHHLDYEYLVLEDSFHTEGFFKRESSLFHQMVPERGS